MAVSRRSLFRAAALAGGSGFTAVAQQEPLGPVAAAHGVTLSEERLRALAPVLARRKAQWQTVRDYVIDDRVGPTQGILDGGE